MVYYKPVPGTEQWLRVLDPPSHATVPLTVFLSCCNHLFHPQNTTVYLIFQAELGILLLVIVSNLPRNVIQQFCLPPIDLRMSR